MRILNHLFLAVMILSVTLLANSATKIVPLSPAEEQKWIGAVKAHQTADGHTVIEVVGLVEKRAHGHFKVASYDVLYDWKGHPSTVAISYWIGAKRARDLTFADLGYPMNRNGTIGQISFSDQPTLSALEKGVDAMLREVEDRYRMDCLGETPSDNC